MSTMGTKREAHRGVQAESSEAADPLRKRVGFGARFLARHSIARKLQILGGMLLALLLTTGILVYHDSRMSAENAARLVTAGELRLLSLRLSKASSLVLRGDPTAFARLRDSSRRFASGLESLRNGGERGDVAFPPSPPGAVPQLDGLAAKWAPIHQNVTQLLEAEAKMFQSTPVTGRQRHSEELTLLPNGIIPLKGEVSNRSQFSMKRFGKYLTVSGGGSVTEAPDAETRRAVAALELAASADGAAVDAVLGNMRDLASARQAGEDILADSEGLLEDADALAEVYRSENSERGGHEVALRVLIVLVLVVLAMMTRVHVNEARRQVRQTEKSRRECERVNHQNQGAILRLRNELGDLADGDLTVVATVSGDITDAIADSINHTVGELRRLVGRIDNAAGRVTATTEIVQRGSTELLEMAQRQSREIRDAGHSVREVARTMNHVSDDADQSAQVARQSLAAADKGTLAVQNSIECRNEIRQQIQESLKRIKRLGESSREIGEIVDLISDITEQTSVLALNAAIQAASTGNAGRGFTVLAEEVQRRAERSGEATRKIAAIAKAIQSDAQGAILVMEESMRGVVEETKLSAAAGQAFSEIGAASRNLAERIERISESTRRQANATTVVVGKAQSILALTEQTMTGTQRTAQEVGKLAGLATELKVSVAGFRVNEVNVQK